MLSIEAAIRYNVHDDRKSIGRVKIINLMLELLFRRTSQWELKHVLSSVLIQWKEIDHSKSVWLMPIKEDHITY
jgi:hypothetical protein